MGALIARVCRIAAKRALGWHITGVTDGRRVGVEFADQSAVVATAADVAVTQNGEKAQAFVNDYHATIILHSIEEEVPADEPDEGPQF